MSVPTIVVLEGDQTGQELLEASLRVLAPDVIGFEVAPVAPFCPGVPGSPCGPGLP